MEKRSREIKDLRNKARREWALAQITAICLENVKDGSTNTPRSLTWSGDGSLTP